MTGSYCLSEKSHMSYHNHESFITAGAQNIHLQHECKHVDADATRQQHVNIHMTHSGPLTVDTSFQFVDV